MLEKQFDEMLEDIESANDEFVNDYFSNMDELVFDDEGLTPKEEEKIEEVSEPEKEEETNEEVKEEVVEEEPTKEESEEKDEPTKEEITEEESEEKEEPVYKNRFTSFSKSNLNKTCSKNIKVYRDNKFENTKEEEKVEEEKVEPQKFSYNKILDRLDQEKKYDLNNVNDLMKFIDKCETSNEFFSYIESEANDK